MPGGESATRRCVSYRYGQGGERRQYCSEGKKELFASLLTAVVEEENEVDESRVFRHLCGRLLRRLLPPLSPNPCDPLLLSLRFLARLARPVEPLSRLVFVSPEARQDLTLMMRLGRAAVAIVLLSRRC
jgi:hypothetical protein